MISSTKQVDQNSDKEVIPSTKQADHNSDKEMISSTKQADQNGDKEMISSKKHATVGKKYNNCPFCNKLLRQNFCRHIETVHKSTPEGIRLIQITNTINDLVVRARLKKVITDSLRKKGNVQYKLIT